MSDDKPIFELREDGPLIIKHCVSMIGEGGDEIATKPLMALCRCGASKSKPFCDGAHKDVGFVSSGGKPAGRDRLIAYEGAEATVTYNPLLCSHAAECGRLANHIFNPAQKPWIQPDNGTMAEVEAVVAACPSGALAFADAEHRFANRATVEIEQNGPYWVTDAKIDAPLSGEGGSADKYVLCRCGKSGNKPYCDGTHRDEGWESGD